VTILKESINDQAKQLRTEVTTAQETLPFNTSSLPSRKEVHGKKKQKMKLKMKFPLVKLLALFFILLPITVLAIYTSLSKDNSTEVVNSNQSSYSEVKGFESYNKEDSKVVVETTKKEEKEEVDTSKEEAPVNQEEIEPVVEEQPKEEPVVEETKETTPTPTTTETETKTETQNTGGTKVIQHTVKANETIFRIAMTYFSSQEGIEIIKQYNGLSGNEIRVGQVLQIPVNQ